ncbi:hypothetical protein [Constrictibacter sp. MBR-5]|jgi:hypothetical protein|uniref:hypothetical protein n=1 Tax=Constrictibacter sp. MBR-5 TaxID=3156467 RepID=UPI003393B1ED
MNFEKVEDSVMTQLAAENSPLPRRARPMKRPVGCGSDIDIIGSDAAAVDASRETIEQPDAVDLAAMESFPASDPPGWLGITAGTPIRHAEGILQ